MCNDSGFYLRDCDPDSVEHGINFVVCGNGKMEKRPS